jgi:hypothetical protein
MSFATVHDETDLVEVKKTATILQFPAKTEIVGDDREWIGVDLDGTIALYDGWKGPTHIGPPIPKMVARVKRWISENRRVKIFTARVSTNNLHERYEIIGAIGDWLQSIGLPRLEVTCVKDYGMLELWDDRAVQVIANTGEAPLGSTRGLS